MNKDELIEFIGGLIIDPAQWINKKEECLKDLDKILQSQQQNKSADYIMFDVNKKYRFTFEDIETEQLIIISEDAERRAFKKAFRVFEELKDRELRLISKENNIEYAQQVEVPSDDRICHCPEGNKLQQCEEVFGDCSMCPWFKIKI